MEMDLWDQEAIDLVVPGFIEFGDDGTGELGFIAVRGWMDCRPGERGGRASVEFSWQGDDEGDEVSGRGWAVRPMTARFRGICTSTSATTPASAPCASGRNRRSLPQPGSLDEPTST